MEAYFQLIPPEAKRGGKKITQLVSEPKRGLTYWTNRGLIYNLLGQRDLASIPQILVGRGYVTFRTAAFQSLPQRWPQSIEK